MIDIHHHLLPGLDDGPEDIETSIEMARIAVDQGITHVVCTPHASERYAFQPQRNVELLAEIRARLAQLEIPLTLGLGCDFHLTYENILAAKNDPAKYSINGLGHLLVELPDFGLAHSLTETFYEMQLAGLTPILTHPERNRTLQQDPSRMIPWLRGGIIVQVTADSVLGHMGSKAESLAHQLLANRWVHVLATDAHGVRSRPPRIREAHALVAKRYGRAYADLLCIDNPRAAFEGRPLGPQEEPCNLYDDQKPKSSWLRRLFGR